MTVAPHTPRGDRDGEQDSFYVGYLPRMTPAVKRPLKRAVVGLLVMALSLASLRGLLADPFAPAVFEFLNVVELEGIVRETPVPHLELRRELGQASAEAQPGLGAPGGAVTSGLAEASRYLLVNEFKWGAQDLVAGLDGRFAVVTGTLVHRQGQTVFEVAPGGIAVRDAPGQVPLAGSPAVALGRATFTGEIVDSKCWSGVMNPGQGKTHRACAIRCLSGGIPALLVVPGLEGQAPTTLLLVDEQGGSVNTRVLDIVAEPVTIEGELTRLGDMLVLSADPAGYTPVH